MESDSEDLPEGVVTLAEILDRVYGGRFIRPNDDDEELHLDVAIDDESMERLREANPPKGDPRY